MQRMANRTATARRYPNNARHSGSAGYRYTVNGTYVDGSAARRLQEVPSYYPYPETQPVRRRKPSGAPVRKKSAKPRQLSKAAQKNREKAKGMSAGFVLFLALISVAILFFSIQYLQLKSEITSRMKNIASLESELTQLKEDNDAYYSQVTSNVDMSRIKKIAIGRLGMKYPSEDQTMDYETAMNSYVRQYQDIPDSDR
ncbi:MAG: hypothetical protein MRZ74_08070 [Blautia sp.]|nr:hypothetical protein [Blautia sp.]